MAKLVKSWLPPEIGRLVLRETCPVVVTFAGSMPLPPVPMLVVFWMERVAIMKVLLCVVMIAGYLVMLLKPGDEISHEMVDSFALVDWVWDVLGAVIRLLGVMATVSVTVMRKTPLVLLLSMIDRAEKPPPALGVGKTEVTVVVLQLLGRVDGDQVV